MSMTTIVVADDHAVVRQGLKTLLASEPSFSVVGEASEGLEAVRLTESLKPDVLVCDLMMGGINGLEVTRQVCKRSPKTAVVILSMYGTESYILQALRAGARAYVLKEAPTDDLLRAIHEVLKGHRFLSAPLSEMAIDVYLQKTESSATDAYDSLTTREREVLQLAAQGCNNAKIAESLFISPRTVEIHRAHMMRKLGLRTHKDLVAYCVKRGILPGGHPDLV